MGRDAEAKLLEPCRTWLRSHLEEKYRRARITILPNTDREQLRHALNRVGLVSAFPEASVWEVKVDVVGVISRASRQPGLVFVELKVAAMTLRDVGQLLGYCRVCRPEAAYLLSPTGLSSDLYRLLTSYGRTDLLGYDNSVIRVGKWDTKRRAPDWATLIPSGDMAIAYR